jgi:hypothetical protein
VATFTYNDGWYHVLQAERTLQMLKERLEENVHLESVRSLFEPWKVKKIKIVMGVNCDFVTYYFGRL